MSAVDIDHITDGAECEEWYAGRKYYFQWVETFGSNRCKCLCQQIEVLEPDQHTYIEHDIKSYNEPALPISFKSAEPQTEKIVAEAHPYQDKDTFGARFIVKI